MKIITLIQALFIILFSVLIWHFNPAQSLAATDFLLCNKNNGTIWGVSLEVYLDNDIYKWNANLNTASYYNNSYSVDYSCNKFGNNFENVLVLRRSPDYDNNDSLKWLTACVDPINSSNPDPICTPIAGAGCLYEVRVDVTCKTGYPDTNKIYGGCNSPTGHGFVGSSEKCPGSGNVCVWGGNYYGICTDYCGGNTPANNCEWISRECKSSGCDIVSRRTYAAVCNDPDGGADGGNRCAPPPPANSTRTETAFCQGPAGTDRAAGLKFNWDRIPLGLERDSNPYDIQFRKVGGGDLHEVNGIDAATYEFPGNACTTGPGGCSLPYSTAYEWRIQAHTEPGISGPTDWSSWRSQTTNDCSGKPDLRITGFSFQGGNSAGTTDAVVTIINSGYSGTGTAFDVKVNNGNGQSVSIPTNALGVNQSRTLTVPNVPRPVAGSYTATAIVDPNDNGVNNTDDINEVNEGNNNATTPYTVTSHISGIIFIDNNPTNGTKDTGEALFTSSATVRVNGVNYTTTNGVYQSNELNAGIYSASMPTAPVNYTLTTPSSVQRTLGPNGTVNFGLTPQTSTVTVYVYKDYRGNQVVDAIDGDEPYQGATITVTGRGSTGSPYTTDVNGRVRMTNLDPGTSTTTLTIPSGYMMSNSSTNSNTFDLPPGGVFNFFVTPINNPSCAGGLTATPSTVNPGTGVTSQLRCVNPTSPTGDPLSYTWFSDGTGTVDNVNSAVSTWRSPATTNETVTNPSVTVCYQGTNRCRSYTTTINLITISTITGNVYVDENENGIKNTGTESNYGANITITARAVSSGTTYTGTDTNGAYTISNLPPGSYTISYIDLPSNYRISYPQNGPPPNFTVTVGNQTNCNTSIVGYNSAICTNGSISNLNFGIITNDGPWVQTGGSDIWFNNGYPYTIPAGATCQSYASLLNPAGTGTPGVIYTGIGSDNFGSGQASQDPYNWKVGGISSYSESYGPANSGSPLATSYSYIRNLAITNGTPPTLLTSAHCGAGGITNCSLSPTLASGIYEASGNLTLSSNYAFPANRDYVILVSENLRLNGTIDVPPTSTVLFSVQGNIYVDSTVGTSTITSLTPHLEGWFSTDHSFYIEGNNTCPTADNRLNMEGALVVNASLQGGNFYNLRDLCSGNSNCPVFYIKERPDFSLNAPRFIKNAPRVYREVAP
ncbi:MAG: SdrD B-like domain-containing protein [Patescibacteria group bacterium]